VVCRALAAAPVPRPPQPIRAIWIVFCSRRERAAGDAGEGRRNSDLARLLHYIAAREPIFLLLVMVVSPFLRCVFS